MSYINIELLREELGKFAELHFADRDISHGIEHFEKVLDNAISIMELLDGEELKRFLAIPDAIEIIIAAAYCHDFRDHKFTGTDNPFDEIGFMNILSKYFTKEQVTIINDIIDNVSFSKEKRGETKDLGEYNLLLHIVQGADRLEAIGEIGLQRCFEYGRHAYPDMTEEEAIARVVLHCHEKLLHIRDRYTHCIAARLLMNDAQQVIVDFVASVSVEHETLKRC